MEFITILSAAFSGVVVSFLLTSNSVCFAAALVKFISKSETVQLVLPSFLCHKIAHLAWSVATDFSSESMLITVEFITLIGVSLERMQ